ncbi:MAG: GTP cyclohydrolase I FolE [Clostridia bacterium]|nr:GTP cyclohydrolase I FolE [Clostridia bacterium]
MDKKRIENAIKELLDAIGEDKNREGLQDTPARVARMYEEILSGYNDDVKNHLSKTFTVKTSDIVIEKNIQFSSMCEHHLMPFFGNIHIAYIPNGKVVGLSKLARCVETYARRLQLQEQLTNQICEAIYTNLNAKGVMVVCEAEHTCMTCRGVRKMGSKTVTYSILGDIDDNKKAEILSLIK